MLQLQDLDLEIENAQARVAQFTPRLGEVRAPITTIEQEAEGVRSKLEDLRKQQKKLEHGLNNKRDRLRIFEEKAAKARNIRDEAAARTDMDFVKRAVEAEQAEADEVNDQVRRHDMRLDELQRTVEKTREDLQPRVQEIEAERDEAAQSLKVLQDKRATAALHIDKASVRLYERVRSGKRKLALAPLTQDGACGSCYNVLPPQEQAEIRQGTSLRRCEACGVILYPTA
ncbi:MAG TPA: C4-type zinc ribbon domain-containing protein [Longimicrobiales bacterium]